METKFKVGDRVLSPYGKVCQVVAVGMRNIGVEEPRIYVTDYNIDEVTLIDPKTAFLTELKALLEKYGVEIDINSTNGDEEEGIMFLFGKEYISYTSRPFNPTKLKEFIFPITPSNIFDYDK